MKLRDTNENPFTLAAGKDLLVQGNQTIDLFALNHPQSGLFSGGEMVLRSGSPVIGDARYWSGGSFRIEELDGSLGDLYSPNDPVIKANGDVFIQSYLGSSLHIWATGKVEIPNFVWITGPDAINGLTDNVTLTNGTSVAIDGRGEPTLDIRAGMTLAALGTPTTVTDGGIFVVLAPISPPTSADIEIGSILFADDFFTELLPGNILLTNQYQPNSSLTGDITITALSAILMGGDTGTRSVALDSKGSIIMPNGIINAFSFGGKGGDVTLLAQNEIIMPDGNINVSSLIDKGGNVTLLANGRISSAIIDSSGGINGSSGNITLTSQDGDIFLSNAFLTSNNFSEFKGGNIDIKGKSLFITGSLIDTSTFAEGDAGMVKITAMDAITIDGGSVIASEVELGAKGQVGGVEIITKTLNVLGGSTLNANIFGEGEGDVGTVKITATDSVTFDNGSVASSTVGPGARGNGGGIEINTNTLNVLGGSILLANLFGEGDAGTVKITATDSVTFDNGSIAGSGIASVGTGTAGNLEISANTLRLLGGSRLDASTFGQGNAGMLKITATDSVTFDEESIVGSAVGLGAMGQAGGVEINTSTLNVLSRSFISTNTFGKGSAGNVKITATDSVTFDRGSVAISGVGSEAEGTAGNVEISTNTLNMLGRSLLSASTAGQGNAGMVKITATDSITFDGGSAIASLVEADAQGTAGDIEISTRSLDLLNASRLSASTFGEGKAGNVKITASNLNVTARSGIESKTSSSRNAGDIEINTSTLRLTDEGNVLASTNNSGNGGSVTIKASDSVTIDDGSQIRVNSEGNGVGGDILLVSDSLELRNNSSISSETFSSDGGNLRFNVKKSISLFENSSITTTAGLGGLSGNGGNIDMNASLVFSIPNTNNDISANAFEGDGGNINIISDGIFGFVLENVDSPRQDPRNNITASSQLGASGEPNVPNIFTDAGVETLPVNLVDPSGLIDRRCIGSAPGSASEFRLVGRGGRSPQPTDIFDVDESLEDTGLSLEDLSDEDSSSAATTSLNSSEFDPPTVIAAAIQHSKDGEVQLTADDTSPQTQGAIASMSHNCQ